MIFMRLYVDHAFMLKINLSSLFWLLILSAVSAQNIPLETWRTHFSYNKVELIEKAGNKIFCAAENGLFYYDLEDESVNKVTKINGLSDVDITSMAFNELENILVIGYSSGGIDLITDAGTIKFPDFKATDLVTDKAIKDIQFWKDDILIATSLGVIVISISKQEITENFRSIGLNGVDVSVTNLLVDEDDLWAITNQGIQRGSLNDNLLDFNNWSFFEETSSQKNSFFGKTSANLHCIKNDTIILTYENGTWVESGTVIPSPVVALQSASELLIGTANSIFSFDCNMLSVELNQQSILMHDFIFSDEYWLGTEKNGLVRQTTSETIFPEGPINDTPSNIVAEKGQIFLFYGPSPESYQGESDGLGYNFFDGNIWSYHIVDGFYNLSDIAFQNNRGYLSSVGYGIYSMEDDLVFNHLNSSLANSKSNLGPIISDLAPSRLLWIASYNSDSPIIVMEENGEFVIYNESIVGTDKPEKILHTQEGPIIIQNSTVEGGGFFTFAPPNEQARFSTANGLPSNNINVLKVDFEDGAWVGTEEGLVTFPDASFLPEFSQPVNPTFENTLLFEDDNIFDLAIDGGNRLWIATNDGLWVFNASFTALDHFFTSENSPLPSNEVSQLIYNPDNGEMYIQTNKGLVSFRGSSSAGKDHYNEVSIFPNPVRPNFAGLVGITGLQYDTYVKITNINGKLIRELETNGGTASWDLLDYNNIKVNSGIYIVFTSTNDGKEKYVGKIAVVN